MNISRLNRVPETALHFLMKEWLLSAAAAGIVFTSFHLHRLPLYSRHDFEVLFILFVLFVIIRGLELSGLFTSLAARLGSGSRPALKLVAGIFVLSMFITNDVALLIGVPLALRLNTDRKGLLVIFLALSANAGSALTPFGNPQNLFIYWFYHLHPWQFVKVIAPFSLAFGIMIVAASTLISSSSSEGRESAAPFTQRAWAYLAALFLFLAAVLKIAPLWIGLFIVVAVVALDRQALAVDYLLLATFACFFGFTDNLMAMLEFRMDDPGQVFVASAIASQFISNVPAALLFSDFTARWHALLWGVSVGGFGNLIGSLANLIAYRFYVKAQGRQAGFLIQFHLWGYLFFTAGIGLFFEIN